MWHRQIAWIDPEEAAARLSDLPSLSWLDSAMRHPTLGRYSYIGVDPFGILRVRNGELFWNDEPLPGPPLSVLRHLLRKHRCEPIAGLPPFQGGAIGTLSYEFGWSLENRLPPRRGIGDDIYLAFYDTILAFDHVAGSCWLIASGWPQPSPMERRIHAEARLADVEARLARRTARRPAHEGRLTWRPTQSREAYLHAVERVKAYIRAGDIYQANIAQRFVATMPNNFDAFSVYRILRKTNPAPFGAFLDAGTRQILSTSPELFLRSDGRHVETRPIKGTIRRPDDSVEDDAAAKRLAGSRKDRAENVMIVDLLRNDLARVCEPTSVDVPELCAIESYAGLHHLVSSVTGTLRQDTDVLDLVAATFPGGSITGAPKIRAMDIIAEIEGQSRGTYCGAIGAFGFDGRLDLNIAIRTLVVEGTSLDLRTGGGITILSDANTEYEETLTKAARLFEALAPAPKYAEAGA